MKNVIDELAKWGCDIPSALERFDGDKELYTECLKIFASDENFDALKKNMLAELDLGLEERLTARVGTLSGGQRQALTLLMATLTKPKLLLLDEHTAALDPKTAEKVLNLTQRIVDRNKLTTLMITHNMKDALHFGNRLIMMNAGRIVVDVKGEEKSKLNISDLLNLFERAAGEALDNDRMLLG